MRALQAFREAFVTDDLEQQLAAFTFNDFNDYNARVLRYAILWAYFQGNAYRNIHKWSRAMKHEFGLYEHIRDIYNPAFRICTFHQSHLWGGKLDIRAGTGIRVPSALPIVDTTEEVQEGIARLWRDSNFMREKDIVTLHGSIFGDAFIQIVDDPDRQKIYLTRVHPAHVRDIEYGRNDWVTYYEIAYTRRHPEDPSREVMYVERASLDTDAGIVQYATFLNDTPYPWNGEEAVWEVKMPFIPLVGIQHNQVGADFGWSELFPSLSKFRELDDQASKVSDQIRKMVDSVWLFSGLRAPRKDANDIAKVTVTGAGSVVGRQQIPAIYATDPNANAKPLVAPLDLGAALQHIKDLIQEIEKTFPELRTTMLGSGGGRRGDLSGRALLVTRQLAAEKIEMRRVGYDAGLVRAHRMALAMGGEHKYNSYPKVSLEDFDSDATYHDIGARPVFGIVDAEKIEHEKGFWVNAALAQRAGVDLEIYLRDQGWSEERIKEVLTKSEYARRAATLTQDVGQVSIEGASQSRNEEKAIVDPGKPGPDFILET